MIRKIFIVEDQDLVRESYEMLIDIEDGLEVCGEAATAEEALERLPATAPDLVLVDVSLPGMSGFELVRRLRDAYPHLPVLVLSGHDHATHGAAAEEAGAVAFLSKHDGPDAIVRSIRRALHPRPA